MTILQQILTTLTESPGNILYHLVTLFALQVVFAISFSQWLRDRENREAWRYSLASGGLILGRFLVLAVGLLAGSTAQAVLLLPPLEQSLNTMTAVILAWALIPPANNQPRLGDVILLISLLILGLLTFSFLISWRGQVTSGVPYGETNQATLWLSLQIFIYTAGFGLALKNRFIRNRLQTFILLVLLLAAVASLLSTVESTAIDTHILFWTRLGYLVAFPLWAVLTYRQSIVPLVAAQQASHPVAQQLATSFTLSAQLLHSPHLNTRKQQAVLMLQELLDAAFVGIGLIQPGNNRLLTISSNLPQADTNAPRSWQLELFEWAPYRTAMRTKQVIELVPDGPGTRHLHLLYEILEVGPFGATLIVPIILDQQAQGVLLLAKPDGHIRWSGRERAIAPELATFITQALLNAQMEEQVNEDHVLAPLLEPARDEAVSGRIITLEAERDKLISDLDTATNRAIQAESRAVLAMKRAHDLARTLEEMERVNHDEQIEALQQEIETLRESLVEAEDAMALAAAGDSGLSTDWVMLTITRYSGQLEEAQARIEALETELARRKSGKMDELLVSLIQELRTPMTSIGGFTDLLLGETLGILGTRQRDLLQRVQANTERLGELLGQMLQLVAGYDPLAGIESELVDVREAIETAVTGIMPQIREKSTRLDLNIGGELPILHINRNDFQQMMAHLLGNAIQASGSHGRVTITAFSDSVKDPSRQADDLISFIQINITDSGGGIHANDLPSVFDVRHRADAPLIKGLGDTGAGLSLSTSLAMANGGRLWVDSTLGSGSTFSLLFPLTIQELEADGQAKANGSSKETA